MFRWKNILRMRSDCCMLNRDVELASKNISVNLCELENSLCVYTLFN